MFFAPRLPHKKLAVLSLILGCVPFIQFIINMPFVEIDQSSERGEILAIYRKDRLELMESRLPVWQGAEEDIEDQGDTQKEIDMSTDSTTYRTEELQSREEITAAYLLYKSRLEADEGDQGPPKHHLHTRRSLNMTIWTMNDQFGPLEDLIRLLSQFGVTFEHYNLSEIFQHDTKCAQPLAAVISSDMQSESSKADLKNCLDHVPSFAESDALLCVHPSSLCELFVQYHKPLIVYITGRYNYGVSSSVAWKKWNVDLQILSKTQRNAIVAASEYDIQYLNYFTGLQPPLLCPHGGYVSKTSGLVSQNENIGIVPFEKKAHTTRFLKDLSNISMKFNWNYVLKEYNPRDKQIPYAVILYLPSRVFSLSFVEIYRRNIPIVAPSLQLLTRWHYEQSVLLYRSVGRQFTNKFQTQSMIPGVANLPDPNNDRDIPSIGFWLQFMDIYTYPHVKYFQSIPHLVKLLSITIPKEGEMISRRMQKYNHIQKKTILNKWKDVLNGLRTPL